MASVSALIGSLAALGAVLTAIVSAVIALRTYRDQARSRRTQWLLDLRQRFVESEVYRLARLEIEKGVNARESSEPSGSDAMRSSEERLRTSLAITDYLNHFEILECLIEASRLDERDVYYAFVGDLEAAFALESIAEELRRYYPSTLRLNDRFKRSIESYTDNCTPAGGTA